MISRFRIYSLILLVSFFVDSSSMYAISFLDNNEMVVDDDGLVYRNQNVGINISNPQANLHVSGDVTIQGTTGFSEFTVVGNTVDWTQGNKQRIQINGPTTINFSNDPDSSCNLLLVLQFSTPIALTDVISFSGATIRWPGNIVPSFSRENDHVDLVSFYYDPVSDQYYGTATVGYDL